MKLIGPFQCIENVSSQVSFKHHWFCCIKCDASFSLWISIKAVDYYLRAMKCLGSRESHAAVWDSVNWELSTTYFTLATLLQDYAPLSRKAQEQVMYTCSHTSIWSHKYNTGLFCVYCGTMLLCSVVFVSGWEGSDGGYDEVSAVLRPPDRISPTATVSVQSSNHPPQIGIYVSQLLS